MLLETINNPKDIKGYSIDELTVLCSEIRQVLLNKLSQHGGHIGPNLGVVELTVALHYVFNSPTDQFVFDVSHQSYIHKMLTGRAYAFCNPNYYDDVTGYTNPNESVHDMFQIGHTSTSISLACGLAKARDLKGLKHNVVAVIGDGSLSGGEAYEGLNNVAELGTNMIIIVNDNEMSIAENHGGLYGNLQLLRDTNGEAPCNFFRSLGYDYCYVEQGNNIEELITVLSGVIDIDRPIIIHVHTTKGKGYEHAEKDKERWHSGGAFDLSTGTRIVSDIENYQSITRDYLISKMKKDSQICVISSATPTIVGFDKNTRDSLGRQFVDVGIAEEHAVAFASGLAKGGVKAVYPVFSSFVQRAYDQISQDLCINNNPATMIIFAGSVYGMSDKTHLGLYDIAMISNIPNLIYLAPTCREEYLAMLDWSIEQNIYPVAIKVPGVLHSRPDYTKHDYSVLNKYEIVEKGSTVAIIAVGTFLPMGQEIVKALRIININATLINPRYITGIDDECMDSLLENHRLVITIEDGIISGGYGEKIAQHCGCRDVMVKCYGYQKEFPENIIAEEFLQNNRMTTDQIVEDIQYLINC